MFDRASYIEARSIPEPNSGCWLWLLSIGSHGYGQASDLDCKNERNPAGVTVAHRMSFRAHKGEIPTGYEIDHTCRNRCCVNPDHLEAVTKEENLRRQASAYGFGFKDPEHTRRRQNDWQRAKRKQLREA